VAVNGEQVIFEESSRLICGESNCFWLEAGRAAISLPPSLPFGYPPTQ
jgi:hypothetical protein